MKRLCLGLFLLAWAVPGEAVRIQTASSDIEGTWSGRVYVSERAASDPERLQLQINLDEDRTRGWNNWGQSIPVSAFSNLPSRLDAPQDVQFELRRDAGVIAFRGRFENGRGIGHLAFTANRAFARALAQETNEAPADRELFAYAVLDVSRAFVAELQAMGFGDVTLTRARKLRIHGTTADFIRGIRAAGYPDVDLDDVLKLRIHGVTSSYIAGLKEAGLQNPSLGEVLQSRIHGVTPKFATDMAAAGYANAGFRQLRKFRIHGVTPAYVRQMADLGYRDVDADTLVKFRIHGITPKFVRELSEAGYTNLSDEELVDWAIHGRRLLRSKRK